MGSPAQDPAVLDEPGLSRTAPPDITVRPVCRRGPSWLGATTGLYPPGFLLAGAGIDAGLGGEPLRRETAKWIAEGPQSPAYSALVITQTLSMAEDPMSWLPRANARYAAVTRAIDRRMHDAGIATWEEALKLAHAHWVNGGWLDLQLRALPIAIGCYRRSGRNILPGSDRIPAARYSSSASSRTAPPFSN